MTEPDVIIALQALGCFCFPTGSRYICTEPRAGADEDWIVVPTPTCSYSNLLETMISHNMEVVHSDIEYDTAEEGGPTEPFKRKADGLNLIVIHSAEVAAKWIAATIYCKRLNVQSRADRIAIFRAFRNDLPIPTTP